MRKTAVVALRPILDGQGEFLPLAVDDDVELFVLNMRRVDALDYEASVVECVPGTDLLMRVPEHVFIPSALDGVDVFKLPHRASMTYVSDRFVQAVESAELVGIAFEEVWSAD